MNPLMVAALIGGVFVVIQADDALEGEGGGTSPFKLATYGLAGYGAWTLFKRLG